MCNGISLNFVLWLLKMIIICGKGIIKSYDNDWCHWQKLIRINTHATLCMGPALHSSVAPIAARILSSDAEEHGPRANAKCGNSTVCSAGCSPNKISKLWIAGPLFAESTGVQWFPQTKNSNAESGTMTYCSFVLYYTQIQIVCISLLMTGSFCGYPAWYKTISLK